MKNYRSRHVRKGARDTRFIFIGSHGTNYANTTGEGVAILVQRLDLYKHLQVKRTQFARLDSEKEATVYGLEGIKCGVYDKKIQTE